MKIHIKNNSVFPQRIFAIGRGSYGFDTIEFVFSKEWKSLSKKIIFVSSDGTEISKEYNGLPISVPREILEMRGTSLIYVIGERENLTKTAVPIEFVVAGRFPENKCTADIHGSAEGEV